MLPGEVSEASLHLVADDGVAHRLAHHEPDACGPVVVSTVGRVGPQVHDQRAASGASARTDRLAERGAVTESVRRGQHEAGAESGRRAGRQTARLLRPLRRREDRISRPARVRMRRRNPCTLWRRRLFGWYVRLLTSFSPSWFRAVTPGRSGSAVPLVGRVRRLSAGTAHPRTTPGGDYSFVDMRHPSTPGDRATVRAGDPQGQTSVGRPRPLGARSSSSLWMTACRSPARLVTFTRTEVPRHPRRPPDQQAV